ncbi:MAG: dienelactone hydrolase family protein [Pseudomonadota bacterium]
MTKILFGVLLLLSAALAAAIVFTVQRASIRAALLLLGTSVFLLGLILGQSATWQDWRKGEAFEPMEHAAAEERPDRLTKGAVGIGFEAPDDAANNGGVDRERFAQALDWTGAAELEDVAYRVATDETHGGIRRVELGYDSRGGAWIPMTVLAPESDETLPAVMLVPGHVPDGQSGLFNLTNIDDDSYHNGAAARIARAGFVTATIELRGFGYLGRPNSPDHSAVAFNAQLQDSSYKAVVLQDIRRAWHVLKEVVGESDRSFAIAGASLGGELAVAYGALDPTMDAVVSHSYGGTLGPIQPVTAPAAKQRHYCHVLSSESGAIPMEAAFELVSPRPLLALRGDQDPFEDPAFLDHLEGIWSKKGATDALSIGHVPGKHEFFVDETLDFLERHLSAPDSGRRSGGGAQWQ